MSERSVRDAYASLQHVYVEHKEQVRALRNSVVEGVSRELLATTECSEAALNAARAFLNDDTLVFRFLRRAKFDDVKARKALYKTVQWRIEGNIDSLPAGMLHSTYMSDSANGIPLLWLHSRFRDKLGRPALFLRLQHVEAMPNGLHELKSTIIAAFDVIRRYLRHVNRRSTRNATHVLQSVMLLDVSEVGISSLELDMLPFLRDLLKNHYPGTFGTIYVQNYSWIQAGVWRMLKPLLPPKLLARLVFIEPKELLQCFEHGLPRALGGTLQVPIAPDSSDVLNYYARSIAWRGDQVRDEPKPPSLSIRAIDYESIYDVMSRAGSPYTAHAMTPMQSMPGTPRSRAISPMLAPRTGLDTVPTMTLDVHGQSSALVQWFSTWMGRAQAPEGQQAQTPLQTPRLEIPQPSFSPQAPRSTDGLAPPTPEAADGSQPTDDNPVTRYLSWRAHKYAQMDGHVSPYNIENPYFGYPAAYVDEEEPEVEASTTTSVVNTDSARQSGLSRQLRVRRRKRDLLRTLTYLFMLRLLHIYRQIKRGAFVLLWTVFGIPTRLSSTKRGAKHTQKRWHKIRMRIVLLVLIMAVSQAARLGPSFWISRRRRVAQ
ncbi:hypothetical protein MVES1_001667 [Malassezia vespertilionis]|uniref:CRAL-TRIO domain-containing protein n=1 Tax=Malassezia vespertilionis TaxID=2020962 RepID=A0A2N1JDL0_9BASI|nr:uncharacterized protein MVES1_001667 [Malassezia vespertilionis]PKI84629.1 hypothetical protein MVES_001569 [Malassezia vespertilionis]WFD06322.1 hypothetical protein MVES1_001667 [Malassezia vespertilionis]